MRRLSLRILSLPDTLIRTIALGLLLALPQTAAAAPTSFTPPSYEDLRPVVQNASAWRPEMLEVLERLVPRALVFAQPTAEQDESRHPKPLFVLVVQPLHPLRLTDDHAGVPHAIELAVHEDGKPTAYALKRGSARPDAPARIVITASLLSLLRDSSELAFVIAHELAHIEHDHFSPEIPFAMFTPRQLAHIASTHQRWELDADASAIALLRSGGFDLRASVDILGRLESVETSNESFLRRHPSIRDRISQLREVISGIP